MNYTIKRRVIGSTNSIPISVEEFNRAREAREGIQEILSIEEKFNIVLENYAEFERLLMNISLGRMLFSAHDWSASMNELQTINRALVNLLSTCRVYTDQVRQNLGSIFKTDAAPVDLHLKQLSMEYDNHLGYRALEGIRNYSQHRELPLRKIEHRIKRVERADKNLIEHSLIISIEVARLAEDQLVKRKILDELGALGPYVDVKPLVREYLESFMRIHSQVRELIDGRLSEFEGIILGLIEKYRTTFNEEVWTLAAVGTDDLQKVVEEVPIFEEPIRRREWLTRKNQLILNLSTHFITTETA